MRGRDIRVYWTWQPRYWRWGVYANRDARDGIIDIHLGPLWVVWDEGD